MGAGGVALAAGRKRRAKGRWAPGQGVPPGPELIVKNWVEVWFGSAAAQGTKSLLTGVGAALGRGREQAALGTEEVHVELGQRRLRQVFEADRSADRSGDRDGPSPAA